MYSHGNFRLAPDCHHVSVVTLARSVWPNHGGGRSEAGNLFGVLRRAVNLLSSGLARGESNGRENRVQPANSPQAKCLVSRVIGGRIGGSPHFSLSDDFCRERARSDWPCKKRALRERKLPWRM